MATRSKKDDRLTVEFKAKGPLARKTVSVIQG